MILERRTKLYAADWSDLDTTRGVYLRSLDSHGVHGAKQIEVYKADFSLTMAVGSSLYSAAFMTFKGFVPDDEANWDYRYHIEEWILQYGESS